MKPEGRPDRRPPAWIGWLLRLYPRRFRHRHGSELALLMRDRYAGRGARGVALAALDTLRDAVGAHLDDRSRRRAGRDGSRVAFLRTFPPLPLEGRQVLRGLRRRPGFSLLVVATLAFGIGATTAFFGLVNGVVLRPLPFPDPDRLVRLWGTDRGEAEVGGTMSYADIADLASAARSFTGIAAYDEWTADLTGSGQPERLEAAIVSADYFAILGARTAVGRFFLPEEDIDGRDRVVVLEHGFWKRRFGADPGVVGSALVLNGRPHVVVGVVSEDFVDPDLSDADRPPPLWRPLGFGGVAPERLPGRDSESWVAIGRLRPEVSLDAARAEVATLAASLEATYPETNTGRGVALVPLKEQLLAGAGRTLVLLFAAVAFLLAIAIANVSGLMLGRSAERSGEAALRRALGADRAALIRFGVLEGLVLAAVGGAVGLAVAAALHRLVVVLGGPGLPRAETAGLDATVFLFAFGVTAVAGILCGLVPALRRAGRDASPLGRRGAGGDTSSLRLRGALVVLQLSLALVLLHGAGLLGRSLLHLEGIDVGLRTEGLVAFQLRAASARHPETEDVRAFYREIFERLEALPGVVGVSSINILPLSGGFDGNGLLVPGHPSIEPDGTWSVQVRTVSAGYFELAGIPVLGGRSFDSTDREGAPRAAVIGRAVAERFWPGANPVGAEVEVFETPVRIVGVVGDPKHLELTEQPTWWIYLPREQDTIPWHDRSHSVVLRVEGEPFAADRDLARAIRDAVRSVDPEAPVADLRRLDTLERRSTRVPRLQTLLVGAFAVVALLLGALGIYGVASYGIALERRAIAVRIALGAGRDRIAGHVFRRIGSWVARGTALGLVGAFVAGRVLQGFLFGVDAGAPLWLVPLVATLGLVALLAGWSPARRALRTDPATMLRGE